ncbi:SEL1-like repeat protein [Estrella lausannensis]|uniref:Uncharacterized protein n=1 Tax=Estrella lausannensis TaxID=483423 RepID=A0A0H5DN79_9BACT|nr:tetratricopeptide repeat protein [Estrella lausannensis]CRX37567.1 hypothetical protein ELAC_0206 [Estrella lausannensis]
MQPVHFPTRGNPPSPIPAPTRENTERQTPQAPGPNLQALFQQGIPPHYFDPFWNQRFYASAVPQPPHPGITTLYLEVMRQSSPVEKESERKDLKRKGFDSSKEDSENETTELKRQRLDSPSSRAQAFSLKRNLIVDEKLLLPGERELIFKKHQLQEELQRQFKDVIDHAIGILKNASSSDTEKKEAIEALQKVAEKGHTISANTLGNIYFHGKARQAIDIAKALSFYEIGAEQMDSECCYTVGSVRFIEFRTLEEKFDAVNKIRIAAALGHTKARYNYAQVLFQGIGVEANPKEALRLMEISATQDKLPEAESRLAYAFRTGEGCEIDYERAIELYKSAASKGYTPAKNSLASMYYDGIGVPENKAEAARLYKESAEENNPQAQYNYGALLIIGAGIEKNLEEGIRYIKLSAEQEFPLAQHTLALNLARGTGIEMNKQEAFRIFKAAADKGKYHPSMSRVGMMYERGEGVTQHWASAIRYYQRALQHGAQLTEKLNSLFAVELEKESDRT